MVAVDRELAVRTAGCGDAMIRVGAVDRATTGENAVISERATRFVNQNPIVI